MAKKPQRFEYFQTCSRCGGTGTDPDMPDCACDVCENGVETLMLTEEEAQHYPDALRRTSTTNTPEGPKRG